MTIQLPHELERFVHEQVLRGEFASAEEALTAAVRLLQQREPAQPPIPGTSGPPDRTARQLENLERLCRELDSMPVTASHSDGLTNRDHDRILNGK